MKVTDEFISKLRKNGAESVSKASGVLNIRVSRAQPNIEKILRENNMEYSFEPLVDGVYMYRVRTND